MSRNEHASHWPCSIASPASIAGPATSNPSACTSTSAAAAPAPRSPREPISCSPATSPSAAISFTRRRRRCPRNQLQNARTLRLKLGAGGANIADRVDAACSMESNDAIRRTRPLPSRITEFPQFPIEAALIFVGGEARLRSLCKHIADQLKLPGQIGDSICRMVWNSQDRHRIRHRPPPSPARLGRRHRPERRTRRNNRMIINPPAHCADKPSEGGAEPRAIIGP